MAIPARVAGIFLACRGPRIAPQSIPASLPLLARSYAQRFCPHPFSLLIPAAPAYTGRLLHKRDMHILRSSYSSVNHSSRQTARFQIPGSARCFQVLLLALLFLAAPLAAQTGAGCVPANPAHAAGNARPAAQGPADCRAPRPEPTDCRREGAPATHPGTAQPAVPD